MMYFGEEAIKKHKRRVRWAIGLGIVAVWVVVILYINQWFPLIKAPQIPIMITMAALYTFFTTLAFK